VRQVRLRWAGEGLVFHGGPDDGAELVIDGDGKKGQAPMQLLLMSLAGCMAIDVRLILEKSRVPLESLEVEAIGVRASDMPRRFLSIELVYRLGGPEEEHQDRLDRAIALSRDKYCSVLHTLDPEIDLDVRVERI
jgi:putative redox protein